MQHKLNKEKTGLHIAKFSARLARLLKLAQVREKRSKKEIVEQAIAEYLSKDSIAAGRD